MLLQEIKQNDLYFSTIKGGKDSKREKYFYIELLDIRRRGNVFGRHYMTVREANGNRHMVKCPVDELSDLYCNERLANIMIQLGFEKDGFSLTWNKDDRSKSMIQSLFYNHESDDACLNISYFTPDRRNVKNIRIKMEFLDENQFFNFNCVELAFRKHFINI